MASTSAAPIGNEGEFGKLTLPPIGESSVRLGAFEIELKSLYDALDQIGFSKEQIDSYASCFQEAITNALPNHAEASKQSTDSLSLPDIADIPATKVTKDTILQIKYVFESAFVLGVSEERIFHYLVRQLDLLCQKNDAHRDDVAFLFEKLALFAFERKFFPAKVKAWFGDTMFSEYYNLWIGTLTNAVNFIFIAATKPSVGTPFAIDDATRKELCDILRRLWSASNEEAALFYAEFYWCVCRNVYERDNPTYHPLNVRPVSEQRHLVAECAEIAETATSKSYRDYIFTQYGLSACVQKDLLEGGKLYAFRKHAERCAEIFGYSSKASFSPTPEYRFAPLPEEESEKGCPQQ
ncbi:MAG: hypothetical protein ABW189_09505 [Rickettsiales bacterium]